MGLYGLLLGGWSSVMAMMTDSAGAVRLRTVLLFVISAAVIYRTLRENNRLPDGATGMVTGGLVGLLAGGALASMVKFLGPKAIVPTLVAVLAFALSVCAVRSVRRAAMVIKQTTAEFAAGEFAAGDRSGPAAEGTRPDHVPGPPNHPGPGTSRRESERHPH